VGRRSSGLGYHLWLSLCGCWVMFCLWMGARICQGQSRTAVFRGTSQVLERAHGSSPCGDSGKGPHLKSLGQMQIKQCPDREMLIWHLRASSPCSVLTVKLSPRLCLWQGMRPAGGKLHMFLREETRLGGWWGTGFSSLLFCVV
jgi:hypothetical protein